MIERRAYAVQMSFDVPDGERRTAEKAKEKFKQMSSSLKLAAEYLNLIYEPFKKYDQIDPKEVAEHRVLLRKIQHKVAEKFKKISKLYNESLELMRDFSTDTRTEGLMNSFTDAKEDVFKQVRTFLSIFSNLDSTDFRNNLVASIEAIKKQINQLRQLISDRIIAHIDENILAKSWIDSISDKYQDKVQEKVPLIIELFKERQQALRSAK